MPAADRRPPRPANASSVASNRAKWSTVAFVAALALLLGPLAPPSIAGPVPNPLLWERKYVEEIELTPTQIILDILTTCSQDTERGLRENGAVNAPRIAVLGDSVQGQLRIPAMFDPQIHWMYGTHCGESLGTALTSGRVSDAMNANPDALVIGLGSNDLTKDFRVDLTSLPSALAHLNALLDATDGARCRVIYTLPMVANGQALPSELGPWLQMTNDMNNAIRAAAQARPNLYVADWAAEISFYWPAFLPDGLHLSRLGVNARTNLAIRTARRCWAPDSPSGVGAVAGNGTATVWWDPLPEPEKVSLYLVTASDGRSILSREPTVNFPGLTNGQPYQFKVRSWNQAAISTPSNWSASVVPSGAGARFHGTAPVRVLDTRFGIGGKGSSFGPGETYRLPLSGVVPAGASAAVLNITATGQTSDTFVTAWPGGQSRPLASNSNPRPGVDAVPAMVTARIAPDRSIQLFNNSGSVHLIADVIGWYGAPGDTTGALFAPNAPVRVLDTRTGIGGKSTRFGAAEKFTLSLPALPPGASAAVLNVTSTNTTRSSHVTVWPDGVAQPVASSLNPQPGLTRANLTTSAVGPEDKVQIYNHEASTDLIVDLVGSYTANGAPSGGSQYFPMTPERTFDTRDGTGGAHGPITNNENLALRFAGKGAIPATAVSAVDANVTVVSPTAPGHTTVWPNGVRPNASVVNFSAGEVVANRHVASLAGGSALAWSAAPSTHYVVDVAGWFGPVL